MHSTYEVINPDLHDREYFRRLGATIWIDVNTWDIIVEDQRVDELCEYLDQHNLEYRLL